MTNLIIGKTYKKGTRVRTITAIITGEEFDRPNMDYVVLYLLKDGKTENFESIASFEKWAEKAE